MATTNISLIFLCGYVIGCFIFSGDEKKELFGIPIEKRSQILKVMTKEDVYLHQGQTGPELDLLLQSKLSYLTLSEQT
jgi:hypothetical protein